MARYLVTGGAGFIGSNLVGSLIEHGQAVRVLDNFSTGNPENLSEFVDRVEVVEGDIRDLATVRRTMEQVDYVLHQAALPSVPRSIKDPISTHEVNAGGTLNVLVAARDEGVKRVVIASSSSVYGANPKLPKTERLHPEPLSPYAASKLIGEQYARIFSDVYDLETVCLRYFNVFGPRQNPHSQYAAVIPNFVTALLAGKPPTIYGDGLQSRDFTYVYNVVSANLLAAQAKNVAGEVFNIACGERHSVLQLARELSDITGTSVEPVHLPPRAAEVKHSLADIGRAKTKLGWQPKVALTEGLTRTVAWYEQTIRLQADTEEVVR